jgi:hypothetical protein
MADSMDPALYVMLSAAAIGLPIEKADFDRVVGAFSVLARVAGPVMAFELAEDVIAAAVFVPDDGYDP